MPKSRLRSNTAAAAGAEVKLTASNCRRAIPVTSWSNSPPKAVDFHRYTRMGTTSAPAERNPPTNSGNGSQASAAPCSWMATRLPETPDSRRYFSTSCEDSDFGDHSSRRPAARSAPVAFGPRARIRADDNASMSWLASPHPSAAANQPRKPIPVCATKISGGSAINALVLSCSSSSSGSAIMLIAGALQTSAPWRLSSAQSSSARRADVTAIRYPVSGADSGWVISPVYAWQISAALLRNC